MEMAKRSAAIAALCVLVMLSVQLHQVAAMSKFCPCYQECYTGCRHHVARFWCVPFCANKCSPSQASTAAVAAVGGGRGPCWAACTAVKICGLSDPPTDAGDAATCAQNCNRKRSRNLSSVYFQTE